VHWPLGPHWELVAQVPQVPATQAWPPPHWRFVVHATQAPLTQASTDTWLTESCTTQSAKLEHAPQTPSIQPCPLSHAPLGSKPTPQVHPIPLPRHSPQTPLLHDSPTPQSAFEQHPGAQTPPEHISPSAQSALAEQVHCSVVCVDVHCALGPHSASDEQVVQCCPEQTSPALH